MAMPPPRTTGTGQPLPPSPSPFSGTWSVGQFSATWNETPEPTAEPLVTDRRRNHAWSDTETQWLVDLLSANMRYQIALLPGRLTREQEKGQKTKKVTLLCQLFREIFGEDLPTQPNRVKTKIAQLSRIYTDEKRRLGETGAGLLFEDVEINSQQHDLQSRLHSRLPWWETWHRMVIDRPEATPSHILTGGRYDVAESTSIQPGLDDEDEDVHHGQDLPSLDSVVSRLHADLLSQQVLESPTSQSHSRRCSRDENDDEDDDSGEDESISTTGASPSRPSRPHHPHKRPRQANTNPRDAIAQMVQESSQARLESKIKVEEERTKREQMRLEFEREKLDRDERLKREEEDRQERLKREEEDRRDRRLAEERKARLEEQKVMMEAMLRLVSSHMANGSSSSQWS